MGGYIAKGKWLPDRRHGLCKACYARRMRGARGKQLGGRSTKRCANPACPHPSGGYNPKLGAKPLRVHGFCMSCYNLRLRKFKRAMAKQP